MSISVKRWALDVHSWITTTTCLSQMELEDKNSISCLGTSVSSTGACCPTNTKKVVSLLKVMTIFPITHWSAWTLKMALIKVTIRLNQKDPST